jgi:putative dehydrogenase
MSAAETIGVVGLGNMGLGMARNLIAAGYRVIGYNRSAARLDGLDALGGVRAQNPADIATQADIVFIMVVDAAQTRAVIFGSDGLARTMTKGGIIVVTATIGRAAVEEIAAELAPLGIALIDCPVSGGQKGADEGTLTLMASGERDALARCDGPFQAIAAHINVVGDAPGVGQVVKACMQGLVGCIYSGIFEALVLGVKAGASAEALYNVIGTSVANTPLFQGAVPAIMQRRFTGTGSNIGNTYKDLTLALALAAEAGTAMPVTAAAQQFFQAGWVKFPLEDNQSLVKLLEHVAGVEVRASEAAGD